MGEGAWLVAFLVVQRLAELALAQWNTARLRAAGGIEFGAAHYPLLVTLHSLWLFGLWMLGHDRAIDTLWLAVFVLLQAARLWVIASLGRRWTTRVIVLPGATPVARGPYRWLRHPKTMWLSFLRSRWFRWRSDCRCSRLYFRSPIQRCSPTASASRTRRWPGPHLPRVTAEVLRPEPLPMDKSADRTLSSHGT